MRNGRLHWQKKDHQRKKTQNSVSLMMMKKETHMKKGNGVSETTQQTTPHTDRKMKEPKTGRSMPQ
jgi:hypothetical protein